jgi:hypothetical protein
LSGSLNEMQNGKYNQIDGHQGACHNECKKGSIVAFSNTIVQPDTMMVFVFYT